MQNCCRTALSALLLIPALLSSGCLPASTGSTTSPTSPTHAPALAVEEGDASYYSDEFEGRRTASGEIFRQEEMTAAHRNHPFGTVIRIVNLRNGREALVRINDRGPMKQSRVVDLSKRAAGELDMLRDGVVKVRLEVVRWGS